MNLQCSFPKHADGYRSARLVFALAAGLILIPLASRSQPAGSQLWLQGGHAANINAVAWSSDGLVIASASDDATVKLWNTNGSLLRTLSTHPYQATALALSPDSTRLAVGTYAGGYGKVGSGGWSNGLGIVFVWQATNGWADPSIRVLRTLTNRFGKITSTAFSADGSWLASSTSSGSNHVHRLSDGAILTTRSGYTANQWIAAQIQAPVLGITFSSAGLLASACEDGTVRAWNSSWSQVWTTNTAQGSNITGVAFSPNGSRLASASLDGSICIWSTSTWSLDRKLTGHAGGVTGIAFSPDGNVIASGGEDHTAKLWEVTGGSCLATATGHQAAVTCVAFSPDGNRIVTGAADNTLRLWSTADGTALQTLGAHTDFVKGITISPDGALCATTSNDETIQIRRLSDGALLQTLAGHTGCVTSIRFAPDLESLISSGGPLDSTVKLWRPSDGALMRTIEANTNGITALAYSPIQEIIATGADVDEQVIRIWSAVDGSLRRTLAGHSNGVSALEFCPDGHLLISGGRRFDNTVKVWSLADGTLVRTFPGHSDSIASLAIAPDGNTVASASSGTNNLKLWNIPDGSVRNIGSETHPIRWVAFSADGSTLAAAGANRISLWEVASGGLIEVITQEMLHVSSLAYSPNANLLSYAREDATFGVFTNVSGAQAQLPLSFGKMTLTGGYYTMFAEVEPKTRYVIQVSTNLFNWRYLTSVSSEIDTIELTDDFTNAVPAQFYRALTPP